MTWDYAEHSHAVKLAGGPVKYDMHLRGQGALFMLGAVVLVSVVQKSIIWFKGVLLQCLFSRLISIFPQCGRMVFPGLVIMQSVM